MYKVSYTFSAFNNWKILERTLFSALNLRYSINKDDIQWVIVDDSVDKYKDHIYSKIVEWCYKNLKDYDYHIISNDKNMGEGYTMNKCFQESKGEYILHFQDDWECVVDYPFIDLGIEVLDRFDHIFMIQLSKREWSTTNKNVKFGRILMPPKNGLSVIEMADNGFGNNTSQIRLFKKETWKKIGLYLDTKTIDWNRWQKAREGSIVEFDYGQRLQRLGYKAAKINDGQFIHTLEENARSEYFISHER